MMISPGVFFIFSKFGFSGFLGCKGGGGGGEGSVKGQKMVQNAKKILSVVLHISGVIHDMIFICGTHV